MALIERGANPNCKDFDESTPLHCASEAGSIKVIVYLLSTGKADPSLLNKYGYNPSDIALNLETREAFQQHVHANKIHDPNLENQIVESHPNSHPLHGPARPLTSQYGRTAFGGTLRHNDRINSVHKLMLAYKNVDTMIRQEKTVE